MENADIYETVLGHFDKSPSKLAAKLDVANVPTVCMWRKRGIPAEYAKRIELLCGVSVKVTRPTDWHLYWPEVSKTRRAAKATA